MGNEDKPLKTVSVLIGNSDDKLPQSSWSTFVEWTDKAINEYCDGVHFMGYSNPAAKWQNACWVFTITEEREPELKAVLRKLRDKWGQDSIAYVVGKTEFL